MKARSAKAKGSRYENYLVDRLRQEVDKNTHRTPGSGAGLDKNDIRIPNLNIEIEAKNQKTMNISTTWDQVERQLTSGNTGVAIFRHPKYPEFQKNLVVLDFEDFIELLQSQQDTEIISTLDPKLKWEAQNAVQALKKVIKWFE